MSQHGEREAGAGVDPRKGVRMVMAIRMSRHHAPRPPWMHRRDPPHDTLLAAFMVVLIVATLSSMALSEQRFEVTLPRDLAATFRRSVPTRPVEGATPVANRVDATTIQQRTVAPQVPITETPSVGTGSSAPLLAVGTRARIVKTDGVGVILCAATRADARTPAGLLRGTTVTVLELAGGEWALVRSATQQTGWVPTTFFAPIDDTT